MNLVELQALVSQAGQLAVAAFGIVVVVVLASVLISLALRGR